VLLDQPVHLVPVLIALRGELVGEEARRRGRRRGRHVLRALVQVQPEARRRPLVQLLHSCKLGALRLRLQREELRRQENRLALPLPPAAAICAHVATDRISRQCTRSCRPKAEHNEIFSQPRAKETTA
jgi:hypothetical protein